MPGSPSSIRRSALAAAALAVWLIAPLAAAQQEPRATPRAAMQGYLDACRAGEYARAAEFLDLRSVEDKSQGPQLARHLKFVLDQLLWVDMEALSADPAGNTADGMPRRDRVGTIDSSAGAVPILLERSGGQWRIAPRTVDGIEALYDEFGLGPLGEVLPPPMFLLLGELALWQWAALLLLAVVAYVVSSLVVAIALRVALRLARQTESELDEEILRKATAPSTALAFVALFALGSLPLGLPIPARSFISNACQVLVILALAWLAVRAVHVTAATLERKIRDRADTTVLTIIPVGRRIATVFIGTIALLAALQNLGFNVLSIVAGLGVVGIGVALAAQKTFENFFGTLSILVDQPLRRGDFCRFGGQVGTVEDIGLRSTRIRTLDRTLITIPNSQFSDMQLENFTARDQIRFTCTLGLRYETSADQLRHVLIHLKRLLVAHPRVTDDPARVRFVGFGAHSLDLEIFSYIDTADWNEFLAIREDLMLRIIDVVEASGTGFAFPSQTLYLGRDDGLDPERTRSAADEVQRWRAARELPLPGPLPETVAKLEGTLSYPPEGSVSSTR